MEQKRPRGRPKGTQINDDCYLDMVADLMLKKPDLKKTPAIARVVFEKFPEHEHSKVERRLLRKWNETGDERLVARRDVLAKTSDAVGPDVIVDFSHYASISTGLAAALAKVSRSLENQPALNALAKVSRSLENQPALNALAKVSRSLQNLWPKLCKGTESAAGFSIPH